MSTTILLGGAALAGLYLLTKGSDSNGDGWGSSSGGGLGGLDNEEVFTGETFKKQMEDGDINYNIEFPDIPIQKSDTGMSKDELTSWMGDDSTDLKKSSLQYPMYQSPTNPDVYDTPQGYGKHGSFGEGNVKKADSFKGVPIISGNNIHVPDRKFGDKPTFTQMKDEFSIKKSTSKASNLKTGLTKVADVSVPRASKKQSSASKKLFSKVQGSKDIKRFAPPSKSSAVKKVRHDGAVKSVYNPRKKSSWFS